jgi:hypothetical protein
LAEIVVLGAEGSKHFGQAGRIEAAIVAELPGRLGGVGGDERNVALTVARTRLADDGARKRLASVALGFGSDPESTARDL